jgi:drug/metabolite transporter (DMT)-like permease
MASAESHPGRDQIRQGILLMLMCSVVGVAIDGTSKALTHDLPVLQVVWARFAFSFLTLMPLLLRRGPSSVLLSRRPWLQLARSTSMLSSGVLYIWALSYIPLADTTAIAFVSPLILMLLSASLLGERVGLGLWASVILGLAGTLLITQPGFGHRGWEALLPLGSAALYALYQLLTRKVAPYDGVPVSLLYSALVGVIAMTAAMPLVWTWPSAWQWLLMAALGGGGSLAQICTIRAFTLAPASILAPFNYAAILWAVPVGWVVFGDLPDGLAALGATVIVASGLYVLKSASGRGDVEASRPASAATQP